MKVCNFPANATVSLIRFAMTETAQQFTSELENCGPQSSISNDITVLKDFCSSNADFFARDSTENGQRLYISFMAIIDAIDGLYPRLIEIEKRVKEFDFDEDTPGNGYRSYISVFQLALKYAIDLNQKIMWRRSSLLFRKTVLTK